MSKKPQAAAAVPEAAPAPSTSAAAPVPMDSLTEEALRRFAPFLFTIGTESKEVVDVGPLMDYLGRDPSLSEGFYTVDRIEAVQYFCTLALEGVLGPYQAVAADIRAQAAALTETSESTLPLSPQQSYFVAVCVLHKVAQAALVRERRRLAELESARLAHQDLVDKYLDEGTLSLEEAEAAAVKEENAAKEAAEEGEEVAVRPTTFVMLRNFPLSAQDVVSLSRVGLSLHVVVNVNSLARFGLRLKDDAAKLGAGAAAAAQSPAKGGKGPQNATDAKKAPDAKKSAPAAGGGGGKKGDEPVAVVVDPLVVSLRKELAKLSPATASHLFADVCIWDYQVPTSAGAGAVASSASLLEDANKPTYELAQSETATFALVAQRIALLEKRLFDYQEWRRPQQQVIVPPLVVVDPAKAAAEAAEQAAQAAREKADAAAKLPAAAAKKAAAPPPKGGKGGAEAAAVAAAAAAEAPKDELLVPLPPPPLPPLPATVAKLRLEASSPVEVTGTPLDAVASAVKIAASRIATDGRHNEDSQGVSNVSPMVTPRTTANEALERGVRRGKEDVSDYVDYLLATLDGNAVPVACAIRDRRRRAAAASSNTAAAAGTAGRESVSIGAATCTVEPVVFGAAQTFRTAEDAERFAAPHDAAETQRSGNGVIVKAAAGSILDDVVVEALVRCGFSEASITRWAAGGRLLRFLTSEQLADRLTALHASHDVNVNATRRFSVLPDSDLSLIVVGRPGEQSPHTSELSWNSFHGVASFAQYVQWRDFIDQEGLYYYPPPRDEDDEEAAANAAAAVAADEEESEEDDLDDVEYDEDGNELPRKKREKKIVLYDPEYVDEAKLRKEALRRRQLYELLRRCVATPSPIGGSDGTTAVASSVGDQWLVATNHSASTISEAVERLFPDDGCRIVVRNSVGNTRSTSCTVHPPGVPDGTIAFGFRTSQAPHSPQDFGVPSLVGSGVRTLINVEGLLFTIETAAAKPPGDDGSAGTAAASAALDTPATAAPPTLSAQTSVAPSSGKTPRGGSAPHGAPLSPRVPVGTTATEPQQDAASKKPPTPPVRHSSSAALSGARAPIVRMSLCNLNGVTVQWPLHPKGQAVAFTPASPISRGSVQQRLTVAVYFPSTRRVGAVVAVAEVSRAVHLDGTTQVYFTVDVPAPQPTSITTNTATAAEAGPAGAGALEQLVVQWRPYGAVLTVFRKYALLTTRDGHRLAAEIGRSGPVVTLAAADLTTTRSDALLCTTTLRSDGVTKVVHDDGRVELQFPDGTRFETLSTAERDGKRHPLFVHHPRPFPTTRVHTGATIEVFDEHERNVFFWRPGVSVSIANLHTGFYVHYPLAAPHLLSVMPSPESPHVYTLDTLFGGLMVQDFTHSFRVTPFGSCRAREAAELHADPPTDFTVKHRIEVFAEETEVVSSAFAAIMKERFSGGSRGASTYEPLQHKTKINQAHASDMRPRMAALPLRAHRTTQENLRSSRHRVSLMEAFQPQVDNPLKDARIFFVATGRDKLAVEILHADDARSALREMLTHGDPLHSALCRQTLDGNGEVLLHAVDVSDVGARPTKQTIADGDSWCPQMLWSAEQTCRAIDDVSIPVAAREAEVPRTAEQTLRVHRLLTVPSGKTLEDVLIGSQAEVLGASTWWDVSRVVAEAGRTVALAEATRTAPEQPLGRKMSSSIRSTSGSSAASAQGRSPIVNQMHVLHQSLADLRPATYKCPPADEATRRRATEQVNAALATRRPSNPSGSAATVTSADVPREKAAQPTAATHVNPTPPAVPNATTAKFSDRSAAVASGASGVSVAKRLTAHRLVATPSVIDFGPVMSGFRYATVVHITNISTAATRFRIEIPPSCAPWLTVVASKEALAAGMTARAEVEIEGTQPPGEQHATCAIVYEGGGRAEISVSLTTRGSDERPVSQQKRAIRLIGPTPMAYVPGSLASKRDRQTHPIGQDVADDDDD